LGRQKQCTAIFPLTQTLLIAAAGPPEDAFDGAARHADNVPSPKIIVSAALPVGCALTVLARFWLSTRFWLRQQQHPSRL